MQEIKEEKKQVRKEMKSCLLSLTKEEKKRQSDFCISSILSDDYFSSCDVVLSYSAMENEVDLLPLAKKIFSQNKKLALPRMIPGTSLMDFYFVSEKDLDSGLESGKWGIKEPEACKENLLSPQSLEKKKVLVLVPGVAFSKDGKRLGHGKGFYDIYFSKLLSEKEKFSFDIKFYGVCFSCQLTENLPSESHDLSMDKIISSLF